MAGRYVPLHCAAKSAVYVGIKGAEALARWRHTQKGIVAPCAFIGPLEDRNHIDKLTWMMLKKSVEFCSAWRAKSGLDVSVSVNASVKSLADVHFADHVAELAKRQSLDSRHLILEVTESAATIATVAEGVETQKDWDLLRELGCDLAQGYLIAKPSESSEFLIWARDRTEDDSRSSLNRPGLRPLG
jgi:EAL domain-containing protein (putative c-di-GMP-specific phosphodiesterase class I)